MLLLSSEYKDVELLKVLLYFTLKYQKAKLDTYCALIFYSLFTTIQNSYV